ncbi:CDP-glycerol glycerophosphotransferase family protein [Oceanobacillus massiliensis]|uniref:CDP-glycerol glycerophosphotransferase family protein n=1 Tax=Oceanobacillus massiliensis TaxID=1465765 RepID=UPI000287F040|nr:CDP-glycerol glycerophosphotransferase family protein [Oceanobacillus massiliensis]
MILDNIKNIKIMDINLENNNYIITLPVKQSFLQDIDEFYFTLKERYSNNEIRLHSSLLKTLEDFNIYNLTFSFNDHIQSFLENEIWDLYINRVKEEDLMKRRINSNYDNNRFQTIVLSDRKKMFYPYTTKKGKISFRMNHYFLYTQFETVSLTEQEVHFSGYFNFPPLYKTNDYEINNLKLIIKTNTSEEEIEVPVEQFKREDLDEKYEGNENLLQCGIKGNFIVPQQLNLEKRVFLKFYLEMTYTENNKHLTMRSARIRVSHFGEYPIKNIFNYQGEKAKLVIKPTKESKYLSFQLAKYNFKNEVIKRARTKWVRIRRGKTLKKAYKAAFYLLGKLPVRKRSVIFESFLGKQYSDSPRAIYEYMLDNPLGYDMYWSVDRRHIKHFKSKDVKTIRRFSIKWLLLMARAEYWVTNSRLPLWIPKPKHTTYVQTWHGTPLKRLAADMDEVHMPGTNTVKYKKNFLKEASKWDYLVSPNAYSTEIFKRAFEFDRKIIESGYPRNDFLINSNKEKMINDIKKLSNLPLDKKVILYAPTWRDNQFYAKGKYKFDLQMDIERMREELGEEYIIVLRLHYLVAENLDLTGFEGFVYDFSFHEDIRELYLIADLLITDYSSVFFDYANLKRPMLFYVYDIEDYRDNLRGFYFDFESKAPGPLVKTTDEIISTVKEIDNQGFHPIEITEAFYNKFCYLEDGNASKRVVEEVFHN